MHRRPTTLPTPSPPGSGEPEAWGGASRTAMSSPLGGHSITSCPHQQVPLRREREMLSRGSTRTTTGQSGLRARLGATRGGSPGIFGYTGGQGASSRPAARSRSWQREQGLERLRARRHRGPGVALLRRPAPAPWRCVSSSGSTRRARPTRTGVDTWAPTRARTDHAPNTVLCGAFWLKSMKTRSPRSSFHHAAVIRSGRRRSSSRATATAADAHGDGVPVGRRGGRTRGAPVAGGLRVAAQAELVEQRLHLGGGLPDHREA